MESKLIGTNEDRHGCRLCFEKVWFMFLTSLLMFFDNWSNAIGMKNTWLQNLQQQEME